MYIRIYAKTKGIKRRHCGLRRKQPKKLIIRYKMLLNVRRHAKQYVEDTESFEEANHNAALMLRDLLNYMD